MKIIWAKIINERRRNRPNSPIEAGLLIESSPDDSAEFFDASGLMCRILGWECIVLFEELSVEDVLLTLYKDLEDLRAPF